VESDRVNALFARVMSLIPPEELQTILLQNAPGQAALDVETVGRLVQQGFNKWKAFHDKYSAEHNKMRQLDPGLAAWEDLDAFMTEHVDAKAMPGYSVQRFARVDGEVRLVQKEAHVVTFDGVTPYACGDYAGTPVYSPGNVAAQQIGLNVGPVTQALRKAAFPTAATGAAHVRWPLGVDLPLTPFPFGVVVVARQALRMEQATWTEGPLTLHCYVVAPGRDLEPVEGTARGLLLRGLFKATIRTKPEDAPDLVAEVARRERELIDTHRRVTREQLDQGFRYAVTPIFAGIVGSPAKGD